MRKHHLLESMLEFALLASVVGFGLGVLAVFFAASQIFEIYPRSAKPVAKPATVAAESVRTQPNGRGPDDSANASGSQPRLRQPRPSAEPAAPAPQPAGGSARSASSEWPLVVVGVLAGSGVVLLVLLAWLQIKSVLLFRPGAPAVAASVNVPEPVTPPPPPPSPPPPPVTRPALETNGRPTTELLQRLAGSVEEFEHRLRRLEHRPAAPEPPPPPSRVEPAAAEPRLPQPVSSAPAATADENEAAKLKLGRALRTRRLLMHGEDLLKAENAKRALECFEEALALEPASVEAVIKRGNALERLGRLEEALGAYDQAIALDSTATMAYLFKGGVCNRLDRYEEALQCYQRAVTATPDQRFG